MHLPCMKTTRWHAREKVLSFYQRDVYYLAHNLVHSTESLLTPHRTPVPRIIPYHSPQVRGFYVTFSKRVFTGLT